MIRNTPALKDVLEIAMKRFPADFSGSDVIAEKGALSGTVYPLLKRLEDAGWLTSDWEDVDPSAVGRPKRRMFRITTTGLAEARKRAVMPTRHTPLRPNLGGA